MLLGSRIISLSLLLAGIVALGWMLPFAQNTLISWASSTRAESEIRDWRKRFQQEAISPYTTIAPLRAAKKAVEATPSNADAVMQLAEIWFWRGHFEHDETARYTAFTEAAKLYERAVVLRPHWPHHYRNLHDLYVLLGRSMAKRQWALRGVSRYGLWSPTLQFEFLERVLPIRFQLDASLQQSLTSLISFLVHDADARRQQRLYRLLASRGEAAAYCGQYYATLWAQQYCFGPRL